MMHQLYNPCRSYLS